MDLVNECHKRGLAVILDVVYNHLGPEGNCFADFGPYFTNKYTSPWGEAINFDDAHSQPVRRFFIENALFWFEQYHVDALRLDALHAIYDMSARPFIKELAEHVHKLRKTLKRDIFLIGESDLNDVKLVLPEKKGGYGLDAQWNDDFHHALHTILTHENTGYYADFGDIRDLAKSFKEGYVYSGQYSKHRNRTHGNSSKRIPSDKFVIFSQNHDQIGNRLNGDRLSKQLTFSQQKLAAAAVLLSPYIPLLFMGEEYGEVNPFLYFTHHSNPQLIEAVREGRKNEFKAFVWSGDLPDPQDEDLFNQCKLNHQLKESMPHLLLWKYYKALIKLRSQNALLAVVAKSAIKVNYFTQKAILLLQRTYFDDATLVIFSFSPKTSAISINEGQWLKIFDSEAHEWAGKEIQFPQVLIGGQKELVNIPAYSCGVYRNKRGSYE